MRKSAVFAILVVIVEEVLEEAPLEVVPGKEELVYRNRKAFLWRRKDDCLREMLRKWGVDGASELIEWQYERKRSCLEVVS